MAKYRKLSITRIFRRMIYARAYHSIFLSPKYRCLLYRMGGACLGDNVYIGKEVMFDEVYPEGICIGNNSIITQGTKILTHYYDSNMRSFYFGNVTIGENVFVGMNTLFVKPVTIGDNCIIGAGSVITDDIPENSIAAGNPCRRIGDVDRH